MDEEHVEAIDEDEDDLDWDAPIRQLPVDYRASLRYFAFWLANGTLILSYPKPVPDYQALLEQPGDWLGLLIEGHLAARHHGQRPGIERWLYDHLSGHEPGPPPKLPADAPAHERLIVRFAHELGWRRIPAGGDPDDVEGLLVDWGGSPLELTFATLGNVIALDEAGELCNGEAAFARACAMLRVQFELDEEADPPFAAWETALWW